jgi:AcrR family transcriptional regulator
MDRRIRKTRMQLLHAMVQCADQSDWEEISIQQLCDVADVSRSTFYLHFQNKAELLDFGFGILGEEMRSAPRTRSLDIDGTLGILPVIFAFMTQQNHGFLFSGKRSSVATLQIARRLADAISTMIGEEISGSRRFHATPEFVIRFISAGIFASLEAWHRAEVKKAVTAVLEELDEVIARLLSAYENTGML